MAVNIGDYSVSINQEFRASDIRCSGISSPSLGQRMVGSAVIITFTLESYVDDDMLGSVGVEYSTAGAGGPWSTCTIAEALTNLAVTQAGTSHTKTWDASTDLGTNDEFNNILVRVTANDGASGAGDDDTPVISSFFVVDNLPLAPTITAPSTGLFRKDKDYPTIAVEFTIPADPGSDKLWPVFEGDKDDGFASGNLFQIDSNDSSNYLFFDVGIDPPLKPISGYMVSGISVNRSGNTVLAYADLFDDYTGEWLPTSISDARVIIVSELDVHYFLDSVTNTDFTVTAQNMGVGVSPTISVWVFDDVQTDFYVVSGLAVNNLALTTQNFSALADDFGQSIPADFGYSPRIMVMDENDRSAYMGTVNATSLELAKSSGMATSTNSQVTLFIFKVNSGCYLDDDYSINGLTLAKVDYDAFSDGGALPGIVGASFVYANPKSDRNVYLDDVLIDGVSLAKSSFGVDDPAVSDIVIWTKELGANTLWVLMPSGGIPDTFEGGECRYRIQTGDVDNAIWFFRVAFGNT